MRLATRVEATFDLRLPTRVVCGAGTIEQVPALCREHGTRVLLVTARDLAEAERSLTSLLVDAGCTVESFRLDAPEPTAEALDDAAARLRSLAVDCIVGLGGGSALDAAKALSIALLHSEPIWRYANLSHRPPLPLAAEPLPVVAVPTTAGTGSEVTPYAVLTHEESQRKGTIQEPAIFPRAAVIDPVLARTMPPVLTACTGFDALAHALESYLNVSKTSPVAEWAAREAVRLIFHALPRAFRCADDLQARQEMAWAATLAGIAIAHRGTTAGHAVAEPLGALTHLPHGRCVVLATIPVLEHSESAARERLAELDRAVWPEDAGKSEGHCSTAFLHRIGELRTALDLDQTASALLGEACDDDLERRLVEEILRSKFRPLRQHPVELDRPALTEIVREVLHGR